MACLKKDFENFIFDFLNCFFFLFSNNHNLIKIYV